MSRRDWKIYLLTLCAAVGAPGEAKPLKIVKYDPKAVSEGAPYSLIYTQFDTKITWRVLRCGKPSAEFAAYSPKDTNSFAVKAQVNSEVSYAPDPTYRWLLDLGSLDGWFNTTDMSVQYENGRFKQLNSAIEDKTVETVTAAASAVAKVASIAIALALSDEHSECADSVAKADAATAKVEADTVGLQSAKNDLAAANAAGATGTDLSKVQGRLDQAALTLAGSAAALETALKAVTFEDKKIRWPKSGADGSDLSVPLPETAIEQWKVTGRFLEPAKAVSVRLELGLYGSSDALERPPSENPAEIDAQTAKGRVPVRMARPGALTASLVTGTSSEEVFRKDATIVQTGEILYVPVVYKWLRGGGGGFSIDGNGNLTSVSHKQTSAPGQNLAKSVDAIAEQAKPFFKSDLDKLKAENDQLKAEKDNAELKAALNPKDETAEQLELKAINSELALKKAKLELMVVNKWTAALGGSSD